MEKVLKIFLLAIFLLVPLTYSNAQSLKGRILLQVEDAGQAWYVDPQTENRAFLGRPADAFQIMRELGLGISETSYNSFNNYAPDNLSGKILLRVEAKGEAYYVNPIDNKMHYLGRPADAFQVMRNLGLGISNSNLNKISIHEKYNLFEVTKVVDGDTIKVNINGTEESIRMIGLDTPETVDPRKPVQCFGVEASNKAKELFEGKRVKLTSDLTQGDRDKYSRLLRYVYSEDGTLFNKMMIEEGYGHEYTYNIPYKYQKEFKKAEDFARENNKGLWHPDACNLENSNNVAGENKEDHIFYTSSHYSSKLYYCDTDSAWENLSKSYLESYNSEEELLAVYPDKTLSEACK